MILIPFREFARPKNITIYFVVIFSLSTTVLAGQCTSACTSISHEIEFKSLEEFYCETDGDNWEISDGWFEAIHFGTNCNYCEWYGILCNDDGRVMSIDLDGLASHTHAHAGGNGLSGVIPSSIVQLEYLEKLYLSNNNLVDSIPSELFSINNLEYLDLSYNSLNGIIPVSGIDHFYERLDLSHNSFSGTVSYDEWNLIGGEIINFSYNQLEGSLPLIRAFDLYLNNNNFSGTLEILKDYTFVETLNLSNNNFTGEVPKVLTSLIYAKINLSNNDLSGCFPQNIITFCDTNKLNATGNLKLPWFGQFTQLCGTLGYEQYQYGAPCNDGDDANGTNDTILEDCSCGPVPVSLSEPKIPLYLFPNPTTGILNIETNGSDFINYSLYDAQGLLMKYGDIGENKIDISYLKEGVYIIRLNKGNGQKTVARIIKI